MCCRSIFSGPPPWRSRASSCRTSSESCRRREVTSDALLLALGEPPLDVVDQLGGLMQAGINHFHAGVAQRRGDDLGAAVVAVEARLGDEHANGAVHERR